MARGGGKKHPGTRRERIPGWRGLGWFQAGFRVVGLALLLDAEVERGVSQWGNAEGAAGAGQAGPGAQVTGGLKDTDAGPGEDRAGGWAGDGDRGRNAGLGIGHRESASSSDAGGFELGPTADGTIDA